MKTCSFDGCEKPKRGKGLCNGHYNQQRKGQELRPLGQPRERDIDPWVKQVVLDKYRELQEGGYTASKKRVEHKECPRGVEYAGQLRCQGVSIEGVRVMEPHYDEPEAFGHNIGDCRKGFSRCKQGKCRACISVLGNITNELRRQRLADKTDNEIRQATPSKRCGKCKAVKPSDEFVIARITTDGLQSQCRVCNGKSIKATVVPETKRASFNRYRARKLNAQTSPINWDILREVWGDNPLCIYCRTAPLEHWDHLIPLAGGGRDATDNYVPSCAPCNTSKGAKNPADWYLARIGLE